MTCGLCGSGISAEEKYKQLKDGTVNRYVYYGCSRSRDKNCKGGYMREEDIIEQLVKIMDKLDISEIGMRHKFEEEVSRLDKFHKTILKLQGVKAEVKDVDLRDYAKYVLKEGSAVEKRELLSCVKSRLVFKNGAVFLENPERKA